MRYSNIWLLMRKLSADLPVSEFWTQLATMRAKQRLPQALLLVMPKGQSTQPIFDRLMTQILCPSTSSPCGTCSTCSKVLQDIHPDVYWIQPEKETGPIKIEQIREIQQSVYQTPQLGTQQVLIIQPAEAMNPAAAAALLKILEEPSASTMFILQTAMPDLLLPAILSRCQRFQMGWSAAEDDLLAIGKAYPESSPRGLLFAQRFDLLQTLDELLQNKITVCDVAERWAEFSLQDTLWFVYTLLAKLIDLHLVGDRRLETDYQRIALFTRPWRPERLFVQIDKIQEILQHLQNHIALNTGLVLERVLLDFLEGCAEPC